MRVRVEIERPIATVTIAHPPVNALSWAVRVELTEALRALGSDPGVSAVVLTGDPAVRTSSPRMPTSTSSSCWTTPPPGLTGRSGRCSPSSTS
jgi:hypothetical protein